jgi:nucleotide-binding universal stress UspA family protein
MNTKNNNEKGPKPVHPRVMLAVSDLENVKNLATATHKICATFHVGVHIIHVCSGSSSSAGNACLSAAELSLQSLPVLESTIIHSDNIPKSISGAAKEHDMSLLIIGQHGNRKNPKLKYGTTIDPIFEQAPCDVVVLKNYIEKEYSHILIPLAGGPNSGLALEIGSILSEKKEGKITLLTVNKLITSGKKKAIPELNLQSFLENHIKRLHIPENRVSIRSIATRRKIPEIIINEAAGHDMVVMGSSYSSLLNRSSSDGIPETVASSLDIPVTIVRAEKSLISLVKKLF